MPKFLYQNAENKEFIKVPAGEYKFRVKNAVNAVSKAGNETIELQLEVVEGEFKGGIVFDILTFTEKASWRIDTFLKSAGAAPDENELEMELDAEDCNGAIVYGRVVVEPATDKYKEKSKIAAYIAQPKRETKPVKPTLGKFYL